MEYSSSLGFNYKTVEFHNLLASLGVSYNGETWDDNIEVCRDDLKTGLEKLKSRDRLDADERKEIEEALNGLDEPAGTVISIMERILNESDPENGYILLSFF